MKYTIIKKYNLSDLEMEVGLMMTLGWRPQGGPFATVKPEIMDYAQAMIKEENENECKN